MNSGSDVKVNPQKILDWISELGNNESSAVPLLQKIQEEYGHLPRAAMNLICQNTKISGRQLYGVATFYSQFRLNPVGRHLIRICHGTACHVRGADKLNTAVRNLLNLNDISKDTTESKGYTIEDVACVGCCSLAPVMVIDEEIFGELEGMAAIKEVKKHARIAKEEL